MQTPHTGEEAWNPGATSAASELGRQPSRWARGETDPSVRARLRPGRGAMAASPANARRLIGRAARLLGAALLVTVAVGPTMTSAAGAGGRFQLYLVNSGPPTTFYPVTATPVDPDCIATYTKPASLSRGTGTSVQTDSPGFAFDPDVDQTSRFSYTVPAGVQEDGDNNAADEQGQFGGFTVPSSPIAIELNLWAYSGDGTCFGQNIDQTVDWRVLCSGTCGTDVNLTGAGQVAKPGWQAFAVPKGTSAYTLFTDRASPSSKVKVAAGDVITLELSADSWVVMQWSAPSGSGVSSISILGS